MTDLPPTSPPTSKGSSTEVYGALGQQYVTRYHIKGQDIVDEAEKVLASGDVPFKYNEKELLDELRSYLASTYGKHYVGDDNVQAMDLIASAHHAEGFCIGSIIKYASRYGKKGGRNRADLLKIIHYAFLALWDKDKRGL